MTKELRQERQITVVYAGSNDGPHSVWGPKLKSEFNGQHYIVTDSDCDYEGIPDDWLDKMLGVFELLPINKVGFSLTLSDLPENSLTDEVRMWEEQFWKIKAPIGWKAHIDTTFALCRVNTGFTYDAIRLDNPYIIRHLPWYIEELTPEWEYYLEHASGVSTWGTKIKKALL